MARKLLKKEIGPTRHDMIYNIPKDIAPQFVEDCLAMSGLVKIDTLDCSKSFLRVPSDLKLEEARQIIEKAKERFYSLILRNCHHSQFGGNDDKYWEFCASGSDRTEESYFVEHFVWIELKEEDGNKLIEKYKLKKNDEL